MTALFVLPVARSTLAAAALALIAAPAVAGDAVKLEVEFPPDVPHLEPGDTLDVVQVVGIDADGARVGFGGRTVRLTASAGQTRVVDAPFRFGYTAPATIDGPTPVTFTAVLDGAPGVRGTARLDVLPKGPYVRLRVVTDRARVDWGASTTVRVEGEDREGRLAPVVKGKVVVTVDGPGEVTFLRLGAYRFTAPDGPPARGGESARITASIDGRPEVHGESSLTLGAAGIRLPPTTSSEGASPPGGKPDAAPPDAAGTDAGRADKTSADAPGARDGERGKGEKGAQRSPDASEAEAVAWPGGALGVLAWRARPDVRKGTRMRRMKRLPEPGAEFAVRDVQQRVRALILAKGDGEIRAEWRLGDAEPPLAKPPGTLKTLRDRLDRRVVVVDAQPPETGEPLRVRIVVTTPSGDVHDELVFRRKTGDGGGDGEPGAKGRKKKRAKESGEGE